MFIWNKNPVKSYVSNKEMAMTVLLKNKNNQTPASLSPPAMPALYLYQVLEAFHTRLF